MRSRSWMRFCWTLPDTRVAVLQDWMKGRRGEVDDINGLVAREHRLGGRAPVNEKLVEIATRIESGALTADPSNVGLCCRCSRPDARTGAEFMITRIAGAG